MSAQPIDHDHDRLHKEIDLLYEIGQAFYSTLEVEPLAQTILQRTRELLEAEGGSVWLYNESRDRLLCAFAAGPGSEKLVGMALNDGEGIAGWVAQSRQSAMVDHARTDPRWASRFDESLQFTTRNLISAPLVARGRALGAVDIINKTGAASFTLDDQETLARLTALAALAIYNAQLFERDRRQMEQQRLVQHVSELLHSTLDLDRLLEQIFEQATLLLNAEATSVWLVDETQKVLVCKLATGFAADILRETVVPLGRGVVGLAASSGQPILIADAQNDPRVFRQVDATTGFVTRSLLTVPMIHQGKCLGAIQVVNKKGANGTFNAFDQEVLERLADSAALAIENARLYNELQQSYDGTLDALAGALDLRDRETQGHSRRVVEYTARLAHEVGMSEEELVQVRRGALLHDIGKIGVPDRILHKPGPLDAEERKVVRRHPWLGFEMLIGIPFLARASEIVLAHQERYDGDGYPRRLSGPDIPLGARLFAIADTFDAITSDRPYRKGKSYDAAAAEIAAESGKQFDPKAVEAFLRVPPDEWEKIRSQVQAEMTERRGANKLLAISIIDHI